MTVADASSKRPIERFKTAIRRFQPSRPIALALAHGLIRPGVTVLDYGCGHGDDVRHLSSQGISACGWDPHYQNRREIAPADVVNLGYVLNVIEDPTERTAVLSHAFELARHLLIVAVRVDRGPQSGVALNDGMITSRGGFQKIYTQAEFKSYLEAVCGHPPTVIALGIAYIFTTDEWQSKYLELTLRKQLPTGRRFAISDFEQSELGAEYLRLARTLTRLPRPREFSAFQSLRKQFGSLKRIQRLASAILDPNQLERMRRARREDFLVSYAAMRLQGLRLPHLRFLAEPIQADILSIWPSFKAAREEGERFLFSLGNAAVVVSAVRNASIGKFVGDALYAHCSVENQLPPICRLQICAARRIVGDVEYDIVKLSADGRHVSFLRYPGFDTVAHPSLFYSLSLYLPKVEYSYREFSDSENPPILHRKDALVDETYPHYQKFAALTLQEEKHGLLSRADIGHKQQWEQLLIERGLCIRGHRLMRANAPRKKE